MKKDVSGIKKPQEALVLTENYFNNRFVSSRDFLTEANFQEISKTKLKDFYPLTFSQKRLYNSNNNSNSTTLGILFVIKLAPSKIKNILNKLIEIHSSLRYVFQYIDGKMVGSILDNQTITIETERSSFDVQTLVDNYYNTFDLLNGPLIHTKIVFLEGESSLLLLDIHNLAFDKISIKIFLQDFFNLYNEKEINKHSMQYIDYASFEYDFLNSNKSNLYDKFWKDKFKNQDFALLNLPYDFPLSDKKSYEGETINLELSKDYLEQIQNIAKKINISTYSVLLSCLYILLYKYTNKSDIIIGMPFDGRCFKDSNNLTRKLL